MIHIHAGKTLNRGRHFPIARMMAAFLKWHYGYECFYEIKVIVKFEKRSYFDLRNSLHAEFTRSIKPVSLFPVKVIIRNVVCVISNSANLFILSYF